MKLFSKIFVIMSLFLISYASSAQKSLDKGSIKMEVTDIKSDDPNVSMGLEMMKGSQTNIVFDGTRYAVNMDMMGGMVTIKMLVEKDSNQMDMIFEMMGNKMWVQSDLDKSQTEKEKAIAAATKIEVDKNDTKEILGYKCYKMILTNPEMDNFKVESYITEDIKIKASFIQGLQSLEFPGFTLEYSVKNPMMTMTIAAKEVTDKVDDKQFILDTKGCKKMTMEEFQKTMGAMGGGF